jgi:predicted N-acetyltransferase YhbS
VGDSQLVEGITEACKSAHKEIMAAEGLVLTPRLFVFRDGHHVGYVALRPVHVGKDAVDGIAQMSFLAAAAEADEVIGVGDAGSRCCL